MTETFNTHCAVVYRALDERATFRDNEGQQERVFVGAVTPVFKSLGISQAYYGPIFKTLEDVGAILKVQTGARGIDTIMVLRGLPEAWPTGLGWDGSKSRPLTEDSRYGKVLRDVQEMQGGKIGGVNVLLALAELEQRIIVLEKALRTEVSPNGKSKK